MVIHCPTCGSHVTSWESPGGTQCYAPVSPHVVLRSLQTQALRIADLYGDRDPPDRLAVLTEEVGEVARCIIKRRHGLRPGTDWNDELRKELGDVLVSLAALAAAEDVDLYAAGMGRVSSVLARFPESTNEEAVPALHTGTASEGPLTGPRNDGTS